MNRWVLLSASLHVAAIYGVNALYTQWADFKPAEPYVMDVTIEMQVPETKPQKLLEPRTETVPEEKSEKPIVQRKTQTQKTSSSQSLQNGSTSPQAGSVNGTGETESAHTLGEVNPKPRYPDSARRARKEGTVLLSVFIGNDGAVSSVTIAQSSGTESLDESAKDTVLQWRFKPAVMNGSPIASSVTIPIKFELVTK